MGKNDFLSACSMALLIINNCGRVSLEQSREKSHWIKPWKHHMSNIKNVLFFLIFQASKICCNLFSDYCHTLIFSLFYDTYSRK